MLISKILSMIDAAEVWLKLIQNWQLLLL